jgi:hypothetical protein
LRFKETLSDLLVLGVPFNPALDRTPVFLELVDALQPGLLTPTLVARHQSVCLAFSLRLVVHVPTLTHNIQTLKK